MNYEEWTRSVPDEITGDSLWKMNAYRLALFAADIGWNDVTKLMGDKRTIELSNQLYRALGIGRHRTCDRIDSLSFCHYSLPPLIVFLGTANPMMPRLPN